MVPFVSRVKQFTTECLRCMCAARACLLGKEALQRRQTHGCKSPKTFFSRTTATSCQRVQHAAWAVPHRLRNRSALTSAPLFWERAARVQCGIRIPAGVRIAGRTCRHASTSSWHQDVSRFQAASKSSQTAGGAFVRSCRTSRARAMITACSGALRPSRVNNAGFVTKCPKCQDCNRWRAAFSKKPVRYAVARAETAILVARVAYAAGKTRPANHACLRAQGIEGLAISPRAWAHAVCAR